MRLSRLLGSIGLLFFASTANAADIFVSPTGVETAACTRADPCSLPSAGTSAVAGDTVILMDGIYDTPLYVTNSGTDQAWITFRADECATPIIEGPGAGPNDDDESGGVGSAEAEYVRFDGIVARGWNIGFGNGWAGGVDSDEESNGHWEIENCISYSNGRTGFTFFSAQNFTLRHSISAHNGSSQAHSWSSGVTLFEAAGTTLVEGNVSFENTDAERNTDGSGFIADEASNNATFVNNIAFGNGGSCLRLTDSSGTRFINNTCYHNSQLGSRATGPSNPSEIYFTNAGVTVQGVSFINNVIIGTGQAPAGSMPIVNQPQSGWSNNVVQTGSVGFFTDPTGSNPDFRPGAGDSTLTGQGASGNGSPTDDIGFDPKCIVKRTPVMVGQVATESWWQYDVDVEYIQSIGGVAACFNAGARAAALDVGAYVAGDLATVTPGSCIPPEIPEATGGAGGMGGAGGATGVGGAGAGGTGADTTSDGVAMGGTTGVGGASAGGVSSTTGSTGESVGGTGGATSTTTGLGTTSSVGGMATDGSTAATSTGVLVDAGLGNKTAAEEQPAGCGCRLGRGSDPRGLLATFAALGLGLVVMGRRRSARA